MAEVQMPPYLVGLDTISNERDMPAGAVRAALNVEFDREGHVRRRPGAVRLSPQPVHSLWKSTRTGKVYGVSAGDLVRVEASATGASYAVVGSMPNDAEVSFTELADRVVATSPFRIVEIFDDDTMRGLGVSDCGFAAAVPGSAGGMRAGRYGVAVSFLRGHEEGAVSPVRFVDVDEGGGIDVNGIVGPGDGEDAVAVYLTAPNGDALFQTTRIPAGVASVSLARSDLGRAASTQHLRKIPPGAIVRLWRGHLLVVRGRALYFSEPMRYGLFSPTTGFIQEASEIKLIAPVDGGVFVATSKRTFFYQGSRPGEWSRAAISAAPAVPGTAAEIPMSLLSSSLELGSTGRAAIWLTASGYVVGLPDGQLIQPQADRMAINPQRGQMVARGRQFISLTQ